MADGTRNTVLESRAALRAIAFGASVLLTAGCGPAEDENAGLGNEPGEFGQISQAITDGWTALDLINGAEPYCNVIEPAVGIVDGVVRFRGALKGPNATSTAAFVLPEDFRPYFTDAGLEHVGADRFRLPS